MSGNGLSTDFPIRYNRLVRPLLWATGVGPKRSWVRLDDDHLGVRMGWAFRSRIPRSSISTVDRAKHVWFAIGVHGWAGRWIVNGSGRGMVTVRLDPPARAWVGPVPVKLRELWVSLTDRDEFVAALGR